MFYYNTRYRFQLADQSPDNIAGGIIAASAMPLPQLARRAFKRYEYLQHRLFDPQLYLADIDARNAEKAVAKLGTYPWFGCAHADFDSGKGGGIRQWKEAQTPQLIENWPAAAATDERAIESCIRAAVSFQQSLECEAILLPSPMSRVPSDYATETRWLDLGLHVCATLRVAVPIYATVAIADNALRLLRPTQNPFLQTVTAQIGAREGLAGAYIVIAQESEDGYICRNADTLLSLLMLVDDIVRGSGREAIVNYLGTFGAIASAVGARIWSSGFYRAQRRLRTSDFDDGEGRMFPRYYSTRLLGDIGVEEDLNLVARDPRTRRALTDTVASERLNEVLRRGGEVGEVQQWEYQMTNTTAANAHYNSCMQDLASSLDAAQPEDRLDLVQSMLRRAESLAERVKEVTSASSHQSVQPARYTDVSSQRIWREVFDGWRLAAGV